MSATRVLKSLVPPVLWRIGSRVKRRMLPSTTLLAYAPLGWETRLRGGASGDDYWTAFIAQERSACEQLIARIHAGAPLLYDDSQEHPKYALYAYVLALAARDRSRVTVLDYGGNLGDYYWLGRALVPGIDLDYHCKELPHIAEAGRLVSPDVTWHTDDACLDGSHDLVMFSSSIQCLRNWQEVLGRAARGTRGYLLLSDVAAVQNVPTYVATTRSRGQTHLQVQINRQEIIRTAAASGLRLVREFPMGAHPPIVNAPEQPICIGWLFERPRP